MSQVPVIYFKVHVTILALPSPQQPVLFIIHMICPPHCLYLYSKACYSFSLPSLTLLSIPLLYFYHFAFSICCFLSLAILLSPLCSPALQLPHSWPCLICFSFSLPWLSYMPLNIVSFLSTTKTFLLMEQLCQQFLSVLPSLHLSHLCVWSVKGEVSPNLILHLLRGLDGPMHTSHLALCLDQE